jgi:hypothetical protein
LLDETTDFFCWRIRPGDRPKLGTPMRDIYICIALTLFSFSARAQIQRGSLVVYILSKNADYVVVGAESRTTTSTNLLDDRSCKIISLGGDTLSLVRVPPKSQFAGASLGTANELPARCIHHPQSMMQSAFLSHGEIGRWVGSIPNPQKI